MSWNRKQGVEGELRWLYGLIIPIESENFALFIELLKAACISLLLFFMRDAVSGRERTTGEPSESLLEVC